MSALPKTGTKICFKCRGIKPLSMFYKHGQMADGLSNKCKLCIRADNSLNNYDNTEKGVVRVIYKTQKSNSKRRGHNPPTYTKEELKTFMYENGFKRLYDEWVDSGFIKTKKPSIDRKNDYKGYSLDNISLTTWEKNKAKQTEDILLGRSTSGERCKPVLCFNKDGGLVAEYVSYSSAKRAVGYSLERALKSHSPDRANGFIWWYKTDYEELKIKA